MQTYVPMGRKISLMQKDIDATRQKTDEVAEQASTVISAASDIPQLASLAKMQVATISLAENSDDEVTSISSFLPEWNGNGKSYKTGDTFTFNNKIYRVAQAHTSQADWTPDTAVSLYYVIEIAPDGVLIWRQPAGAHDAPNMDARRHYPDADGAIYVSKRDGNTSVPGTDQWWVLEE